MSTIEIVRREQRTETRIHAMDAHEIVDEIHAREDEIDQLVDRTEALRADLKAVAVALDRMLPWTRGVMDADEPGVSNYAVIILEADKALARPGVVAVLEGVKDG